MKFNQTYFESLFKSYPELLAFLNTEVDATHDFQITAPAPWTNDLYQATAMVLPDVKVKHTNEPLASLLRTANPEIRSIELERTVFSIMTMQAIVENNYDFFKKTPVYSNQLIILSDQFQNLCTLLQTYFPTDLDKNILLRALILSDLGKIRPLREALCKLFYITAQDPDHFMSELLRRNYTELSAILPSINNEITLTELRKINTEFHYGHFAHAESGERELARLKDMLAEHGHGVEAIGKHFILQICDVAGAAAQDGGKTILTQQIATIYLNCILPALLSLTTKTPTTVHENYFSKRFQLCQLPIHETPLTSEQHWLGRFICMLRIDTLSAAEQLQTALKELLANNPKFVADLESWHQYQLNPKLSTPTYMPALLVALKNKEPLTVALQIGATLIRRALECHQYLVEVSKIHKENPANFNALTGITKNEFDCIQAVYKERSSICFCSSNGIVYPTQWIKQHKPAELAAYVSETGIMLDQELSTTGSAQFFDREKQECIAQSTPVSKLGM